MARLISAGADALEHSDVLLVVVASTLSAALSPAQAIPDRRR
ncbi:MAG: hypothetical protein AAAC47_12495 [Pararhizobium sp.]